MCTLWSATRRRRGQVLAPHIKGIIFRRSWAFSSLKTLRPRVCVKGQVGGTSHALPGLQILSRASVVQPSDNAFLLEKRWCFSAVLDGPRSALGKWLSTHNTNPLSGAPFREATIEFVRSTDRAHWLELTRTQPSPNRIAEGIDILRETEDAEVVRAICNLVEGGVALELGGTSLFRRVFLIQHDDVVFRIALKMIGHGADVNSANFLDVTALHDATSVDRARFLIEHGADVNRHSELAGTALHAVCSRGSEKIAKYLISVGANVEATFFRGQTPLISAAKACAFGTMHVLLDKGADPTKKCDNQDALMIIMDAYSAICLTGRPVSSQFLDGLIRIIRRIAPLCDINATNEMNQTPLKIALSACSSVSFITEPREEIVQKFVEVINEIHLAGGNPSLPNGSSATEYYVHVLPPKVKTIIRTLLRRQFAHEAACTTM